VPGEATQSVTFEIVEGEYDDGTPYELLRPTYELTDFGYGEPSPDLGISPRVAPQMIGLGLLEAIPADRILSLADPALSEAARALAATGDPTAIRILRALREGSLESRRSDDLVVLVEERGRDDFAVDPLTVNTPLSLVSCPSGLETITSWTPLTTLGTLRTSLSPAPLAVTTASAT